MAGGLARTQDGTPSWPYTKTLAGIALDTFLQEQEDRYGLTDLEVCRILSTALHERIGLATRDEQRRNPDRKGVIGTPREDVA